MRIALISDQHFDASSRWEETIRLTDWIADDLARRGVDLITLGGDLFERRAVGKETDAASRWLINLAETAPVLGVYGNHDKENDLAVLGKLEARNSIQFCDRPKVCVVESVAAVACLPWPYKSQILAMMPEATVEGATATAALALQNVLRGLGMQLQEHSGPRLFLGHAMVRGSRTSMGQPLCGCDFELGLDDLGLVGASAYLLGHIHCGQDWQIGDAPVIYPGSPRRTAYGEVEDKAYVTLDYDGDKLVGWERVIVPATRMLLVESKWVDGLFTRTLPLSEAGGAEIRFRYTVGDDHRAAAKLAANTIEAELIGAGAIAVKVEEETTPTTRSRAPEITTAKLLTDQLDQLWKAQGWDPGDRRDAILGKAADLEREERKAPRRSGGVRLRGFRLLDIGPVRDVEVDFDDYPDAQLIAITGPNGIGKSTCLEAALPGAMFRDTPTRGKIQNLATSRRSMVESRIVTPDGEWTLRHLIDSVSDKGESTVLDQDGKPAYQTTLRSDFDRWSAANLVAPSELYVSTFAAQGSRGLIGMTDGERKSVILKVLGLSDLEVHAERARKRAAEAKTSLATHVARLEEQRSGGCTSEEALVELQATEVTARSANKELQRARDELLRRERMAGNMDVLLAEHAAARRVRDDLQQRIEAATTRLANVDIRIGNNKTVLAQAETIRAAVADLAAARAEIEAIKERAAIRRTRAELQRRIAGAKDKLTEVEEKIDAIVETVAARDQIIESVATTATQQAIITRATAALESVATTENAIQSEITAAEKRAQAAQGRIARANARLVDREAIEGAVADLPALEAAVQKAEASLQRSRDALSSLQQDDLGAALQRGTDLRTGIDRVAVAGTLDEVRGIASTVVGQDDAFLAARSRVSDAIAAAEIEISNGVAVLWQARDNATKANALAARQPDIIAATADLDEATKEHTDANAELTQLAEKQTAAGTDRTKHSAELVSATAEVKRLEPLASKQQALSTADAVMAELDPQRESLRAEILSLEQQLSESPEPPADIETLDQVNGRIAILEPTAAKAEPLSHAEVRLGELNPQRAAIADEIANLTAELATHPEPDSDPVAPDVEEQKAVVATAEWVAKDAEGAVAVAKQRCEEAAVREERIQTMVAEQRALEAELADWTRLGTDLGKDGLQALMVDAAGPDITARTNDLLHNCVGSRFTVRVDTQPLNADGSKMLEGCAIGVTDTETGYDGEARTYSGGQKVLLNEALSLALMQIGCARVGAARPTLARDESGAALDVANSRAYVAMLRRAAIHIGADKVLLVSHSQDVIDLADARIDIGAVKARGAKPTIEQEAIAA